MADKPLPPPPLPPTQPTNRHKTNIDRPSATHVLAMPKVFTAVARPQAELSLPPSTARNDATPSTIYEGCGLHSTSPINPDRFDDHADGYANVWYRAAEILGAARPSRPR